MDGGTGGIGPVSRQFLWRCAKMAKDTGVDKWIPKFWQAANAGKTTEAANFYKIICTVIKNNAGKAFAEDMEAMLPEMVEALGELGIDAATLGTEIIGEALATGTGAALSLNPVAIAIIAAIVIGFLITRPGHTEELPHQVPPPLKGNNNADPVSAAQMQLLMESLARMNKPRPGKAGH